jgi:hypothetical protein
MIDVFSHYRILAISADSSKPSLQRQLTSAENCVKPSQVQLFAGKGFVRPLADEAVAITTQIT